MTDSRIRSAKLEDDINQLTHSLGAFSMKSDVVDHIRKSVDVLEIRNAEL